MVLDSWIILSLIEIADMVPPIPVGEREGMDDMAAIIFRTQSSQGEKKWWLHFNRPTNPSCAFHDEDGACRFYRNPRSVAGSQQEVRSGEAACGESCGQLAKYNHFEFQRLNRG